MTGEVAVRQPNGLLDKIAYAKAMADSSLLPRHYQKQPANLLIALEYAEAFGISPINAISSVFVIDGKPSASADLIAALVRKAGHKLRVAGDDKHATAELIRADDPEFTYTATWDMDKAKQAGLTNKGTWKSYPGALLRARAITEVARMGASDALFGVIYTPEEVGADVNEDGAPVTSGVVEPVEVSGRDWLAETAELADVEHLRALWREADAWAELSEDVKAAITARVVEVTPEPEITATAPLEPEQSEELPLGDPWTREAVA